MFSSITSFISSSISSLPFRLLNDGAEVVHPHAPAGGVQLWRHFQAVRIAPGMGGALVGAAGDNCSVFTFDKRTASADQASLARNALQRLKTLRHPNMLRFIDSVDSPTHMHILTEVVSPLSLDGPISQTNRMGQLSASLGLQQITSTLSWLNNSAGIIHGNLHPGSLYSTESGDWKLFGLELCCKGTESVPDPILLGRNSGIMPSQYRAPELIKAASSAAPPSVLHAADAWALGCLIFQVFHANFSSPQQLATAPNIPPTLLADYKKLLATSPANRLNPKYLLENSPFFQNELVSSVDFLDNMALKSAPEKESFFARFPNQVSEFPKEFAKFKILPLLTKSLEYGSGLTCFSAILQSVLQIGRGLEEAEFSQLVLPSVLRLFSSNERAVRVHLLQRLGDYAPSLTPALVNETIFTHVLTGFSDSHALLRELTVKSLLHLAPKLNANNMDLALRHLARLQTDAEPAIRTNTGYCIAKIAPFLSAPLQEKVLFPAFSKCLRDPFPPARVAGLAAFSATLDLHRPADVARKILPVVAPSLADDVREVREAALRLLEACTTKMHAFHAQLQAQQAAALAANPNAIGSHQIPGLAAPSPAAGGAGAAGAQGHADAAAVLNQAGAVLGSLGSWAASTVRSKMSNAEANPPPRSMQQGAQGAGQQSILHSAGPGARSYSSAGNASAAPTSSSVLAAAAAAAAPSTPGGGAGAAFDSSDNFFDDFAADNDGEDDGAVSPATVVALSTSKKTSKSTLGAAAGGKKDHAKKSILSGGTPKGVFSPPTNSAASSLDSWNFDLSDSSSSSNAAQAAVVADFDDWGDSFAAPAASPQASSAGAAAAKPASTRASAAKGSSGGDLLSFGASPAGTHHKAPSASSDPFAALSLNPSPSPRTSASPAAAAASLQSKARPAATPLTLSKSTPAGAKKPAAGVDDWGDFLNS